MLDQFTKAHRKSQRRRLGPAALLSIVAHAAALIALVGVAAWRVEKLKPVDPPILLASGFGALPVASEEPQEEVRKPRKPPKRKVEVPVQPDEQETEEEDPAEGDDTGGDDVGPGGGGGGTCMPGQECQMTPVTPPDPVCGNGVVETGERCDDGGTAAGDGCSATCQTEQERVVVPSLIEGHRISGDPQIAPPESVRLQMMRAGEKRTVGTVKMCLTREGAVRSLKMLRPTGHRDYDELLLSRMRSWRYRPYELSSGVRVPVCTVVTFIYQLR